MDSGGGQFLMKSSTDKWEKGRKTFKTSRTFKLQNGSRRRSVLDEDHGDHGQEEEEEEGRQGGQGGPRVINHDDDDDDSDVVCDNDDNDDKI